MNTVIASYKTRITVAAAAAAMAAMSTSAGAQRDAHAEHRPAAAGSRAADVRAATAGLQDSGGRNVGGVTLRETSAGVLLAIDLHNVAPGVHGFHFHAVGSCVPPAFTSAGDHFAPGGTKHGILSENRGEGMAGAHAGDLPNLHVPTDGKLSVEILAPHVTLASGERSLLDEDGSALVLHANADDYMSDPSGNSGDRIACGVVRAGK